MKLVKTGKFNPVTRKYILWELHTDIEHSCFNCKRTLTDGELAFFCEIDKDFLCFECSRNHFKEHSGLAIRSHQDFLVKLYITPANETPIHQ